MQKEEQGAVPYLLGGGHLWCASEEFPVSFALAAMSCPHPSCDRSISPSHKNGSRGDRIGFITYLVHPKDLIGQNALQLGEAVQVQLRQLPFLEAAWPVLGELRDKIPQAVRAVCVMQATKQKLPSRDDCSQSRASNEHLCILLTTKGFDDPRFGVSCLQHPLDVLGLVGHDLGVGLGARLGTLPPLAKAPSHCLLCQGKRKDRPEEAYQVVVGCQQ